MTYLKDTLIHWGAANVAKMEYKCPYDGSNSRIAIVMSRPSVGYKNIKNT